MTATWGEHEPAYYVATHTESKEVVVAIRGTWAVEDVVTDITALPVVCALCSMHHQWSLGRQHAHDCVCTTHNFIKGVVLLRIMIE